jgi:hypothetical protein
MIVKIKIKHIHSATIHLIVGRLTKVNSRLKKKALKLLFIVLLTSYKNIQHFKFSKTNNDTKH